MKDEKFCVFAKSAYFYVLMWRNVCFRSDTNYNNKTLNMFTDVLYFIIADHYYYTVIIIIIIIVVVVGSRNSGYTKQCLEKNNNSNNINGVDHSRPIHLNSNYNIVYNKNIYVSCLFAIFLCYIFQGIRY